MRFVHGLRSLRNRRVLGPIRESINSFLAEFRGTSVLYYPNPGNAGDSLIAVATLAAFARNGVAATAIDLDADVGGQVVFLGGGGNFIPLYHQIRAAIAAFQGRARRLILFPHTIRGNEETLRRLDESCTIFCREEASYQHVRSLRPDLDVRLAHDMAFHLDMAGFLGDEQLRRRAEPMWREKLREGGLPETALRAAPVVDFSRLDSESRSAQPRCDADISHIFTFGTTAETAPLGAWCLLKTISLARRIVTDRLHVGIGAALLGVPCRLNDNSYGKNEAVYRFSLEGRFRNVRFVQG